MRVMASFSERSKVLCCLVQDLRHALSMTVFFLATKAEQASGKGF